MSGQFATNGLRLTLIGLRELREGFFWAECGGVETGCTVGIDMTVCFYGEHSLFFDASAQ